MHDLQADIYFFYFFFPFFHSLSGEERQHGRRGASEAVSQDPDYSLLSVQPARPEISTLENCDSKSPSQIVSAFLEGLGMLKNRKPSEEGTWNPARVVLLLYGKASLIGSRVGQERTETSL